MGLDPDREYDDVFDQKGGSKRRSGGGSASMKSTIGFIAIGIIIGVALSFVVAANFLPDNQPTALTACKNTNELLSKENGCLYTLVASPRTAAEQCVTPIPALSIPTDINAPTTDINTQSGDYNLYTLLS